MLPAFLVFPPVQKYIYICVFKNQIYRQFKMQWNIFKRLVYINMYRYN